MSTLGLLRVHERMAAHAAKAFSAWRLAKTLRQHQHAVCAMEEGCRAVRAELEHQRELSMKERRMRETLEQPLRPPNVPPGSCNDDELVMLYQQLAYWKDAARRQHAEKRHVAQLLQVRPRPLPRPRPRPRPVPPSARAAAAALPPPPRSRLPS